MGGGGSALPDFLFCSLFSVQQTTSGIGYRVKKYQFFGLATNTLNTRNKNINYRYTVSKGRPQISVCESEREKKAHDDRGNTLSVGKGKNGSTIIFMVMVFTAYYYWNCLKHLNLMSIPQTGQGEQIV